MHAGRIPGLQAGEDAGQESERDARASRRGVLAGVGLVGLAGAVSACSSASSSSSAPKAVTSSTAPTAGSTGGSVAAAGGAEGAAGGAANTLATTSEIPVGGGKVFAAKKVVVTQPAAGQFKAFSAVCTHQQCIVDQVANGTIDCPCHGSKFSVKDGSVVAGPAPSPLAAETIKVTGTSITLA